MLKTQSIAPELPTEGCASAKSEPCAQRHWPISCTPEGFAQQQQQTTFSATGCVPVTAWLSWLQWMAPFVTRIVTPITGKKGLNSATIGTSIGPQILRTVRLKVNNKSPASFRGLILSVKTQKACVQPIEHIYQQLWTHFIVPVKNARTVSSERGLLASDMELMISLHNSCLRFPLVV